MTSSTISRSKDLRYIERVVNDTSNPSPLKNPAIYTATYPPPTINVFPGGSFL